MVPFHGLNAVEGQGLTETNVKELLKKSVFMRKKDIESLRAEDVIDKTIARFSRLILGWRSPMNFPDCGLLKSE